jgi:hypothetical protein
MGPAEMPALFLFEGSGSFLKKRTKKLFVWVPRTGDSRCAARWAPKRFVTFPS